MLWQYHVKFRGIVNSDDSILELAGKEMAAGLSVFSDKMEVIAGDVYPFNGIRAPETHDGASDIMKFKNALLFYDLDQRVIGLLLFWHTASLDVCKRAVDLNGIKDAFIRDLLIKIVFNPS